MLPTTIMVRAKSLLCSFTGARGGKAHKLWFAKTLPVLLNTFQCASPPVWGGGETFSIYSCYRKEGGELGYEFPKWLDRLASHLDQGTSAKGCQLPRQSLTIDNETNHAAAMRTARSASLFWAKPSSQTFLLLLGVTVYKTVGVKTPKLLSALNVPR